jgi:outer membrane protein insertion porin family
MVGRKRSGGLAWILILFVLALPVAWSQEQAPKVAIAPFVMHGQVDVARTQKSLDEIFARLATRDGIQLIDPQVVQRAAGGPVQSEEQARSLGSKLGASFVLMGSFNQVGNSISIDSKLVNVSGKTKTMVLYAEDRGIENLASAAGKIVQQMSIHVLAKAIIAEVKVRGNDRIEADAIKGAAQSKKGEVLKPDQVSEDIRAIFKLGFFEKVDAEVQDTAEGKILTFVVQENPVVQEVRVKGSKKIKEKDILAAAATKPYTVLQRNVVSDDVQKILKLYQQKGYYNAEVVSKIEFPKDPHRAVVTFDIQEHKKVYIKEISFVGNTHLSSRKLRGVMQTKTKSILSLFTERGILQKDILDTDVDRVTAFCHDEGFMDAKVSAPTVALKDDGFHISMTIEEGERYKVTEIRLEGEMLDKYETKIVKKLESKPKEYFSREKVRHDIDLVTKAYMNEGYARVEVDPRIRRNQEDHTTNIVFFITKKEVVHIGQIFITGNTRTRDYVIRRQIMLAEGDTFSSKKIEDSLTRLKKLDYFEDVEVVPTDTEQKEVMNLHVKVKEKQTGSISVGGGYSSEDGLFTSGQIQQKNLMGKGQIISLKAYFGQSAQRYMFSFTEPWLFGRPIAAGFDVYDWLRAYQDFTKDAYGGRIRGSYPFGQYSRVTFAYNWENARLRDLDAAAQADPSIVSLQGWQIKSSIAFGVERDTTDHPFLPTKGTYTGMTMEYASSAIGSDEVFLKHEYHAGVYQPLFWKFIGHLRGEVGFMEEPEGPGSIPIFERFFLGGINSLRGWQFAQVGPRDANNVIIGGNKYLLTSVELLFPLVEKYGVRGVIFFDAGNAYREGESLSFSNIRTDIGGGVRWNSPFGPLRIEIGYNLDQRNGESPYQWQFSAGAFF